MDCKYSSSEYAFSYESQGIKNPLLLKQIAIASKDDIPAYNMADERGEWDPINFSITVERSFEFADTSELFGPSGIAVHDATLGIAIMLSSLSSNHRSSWPVAHFTQNSGSVHATFVTTLPKDFYRERLNLKTVLYVYQPGNPQSDEEMLANLTGAVLGVIDEIAIYIDGTGSLFPVKKEADPTKPLWRVECNWADPLSDLFTDENVCIIFNQAHPNYGLLRIEEGMNGSPFLADVLASALQIIITKAIESLGSVDALENNTDALPGSILDAVHYFISTFGWDPRSPERLAESIRLDFDRRTGNDK